MILINMEMPKNCYFCPCSDLEYYDCNLMPGTGISSDRKSGKRLDDCPLIPVPDHGRLIDADALKSYMEECKGENAMDIYATGYARGFIDNAPTIIHADKDGVA